MTSGWKVACFAVAVVCFVLAALADVLKQPRLFNPLVAVGLAFFALVFAWDAVALDP